MRNATENIQVVLAGHVDHGKSTLLGRLFADTGALPDGALERVRDICAAQGKAFEYAFLTDVFLEEQEQGVTIDAARVFWHWRGRRYTFLDAPGHGEFLRNMVTGAARAEAALFLVDAAEGVAAQTLRHGQLLEILDVRHGVVVVNKMDQEGYAEERFRRVAGDVRELLGRLGLADGFAIVPASAREGDNVTGPSPRLRWWGGPSVLQCLEALVRPGPSGGDALRLPVQDVYKFDARRIIAGRVESGALRVGDAVRFSPSGKTGTVRSIEAFPAEPGRLEAPAPHCTGFTIEEPLFLERGEVVSGPDDPPVVTNRWRARVFWLGKAPLAPERFLSLRLATREEKVRVEAVEHAIDPETLQPVRPGEELPSGSIGVVTLHSAAPLALDRFRDLPATGRFVLVEGFDIRGGGIVLEPLPATAEPLAAHPSPERREAGDARSWLRARALRNGHGPALVVLRGGSAGDRETAAEALAGKLAGLGREAVPLHLFLRGAGWSPDIPETAAVRVLLGLGCLVIAPGEVRAEEALPPFPVPRLSADETEWAAPGGGPALAEAFVEKALRLLSVPPAD